MDDDEMLAHVLSVAATVFERTVTADDDFFSVGGDSVRAVEFVLGLEDRLGREVDSGPLIAGDTFAMVAAALAGDTTTGRVV